MRKQAASINIHQLDLFADSADVPLVNDIANALCALDLARAQTTLHTLQRHFAQHPAQAAFAALIQALQASLPLHIRSVMDVESMAQRFDGDIAALAKASLGARWDELMRRLWRELAVAATDFPYHAAKSSAHVAALYLRAGDYQAADAAASAIADWPRHVEPLWWRAVANQFLDGPDAARPFVFGLAWRSPERLPELLAQLNEPIFMLAWEVFCASDLADDESRAGQWFPAWCLIQDSSLALSFDRYGAGYPDCSGATAFRLLLTLLQQERTGLSQDLIGNRDRLRQLHAELFAEYMRRRETRYL